MRALPIARSALAAFLLALGAGAQDPGDSLLRAMQDELNRSKAIRVANLDAPYYIEYSVFDGRNTGISATLGGLLSARTVRYRYPRIQVRVGDYKFDNTNFVGSDYPYSTRYDADQLPLEDSYALLRHYFWLGTDAAYKNAVEAIARKRAALKNITLSEQLPDFSKAEPVQMIGAVKKLDIDENAWKARVQHLSEIFLKYPGIASSSVDLSFSDDLRYFVNSEGTRFRAPETAAMLRAKASAQAPDGMVVRDAVVFHSIDSNGLPPEIEIERGIQQVAENVSALTKAPAGEPYSGPVLFEGTAGPQILAELLGRQLAITRAPVSLPGRPIPVQTSELENRIAARILPEWMDVVDDPTQTEWRGRALFGSYPVDLEGVVPRPLSLVEKGVLKNFLLTRRPVRGFDGSNGRARLPGPFGSKAATISNLFVRASETTSPAQLEQKLMEICQQRNKPYGLIVRKMDFPSSAGLAELRRLLGGMAQSGAARPVSLPLLVYRLYPDGRKELIRGLRFKGLSARSLKDIMAASDETYVFDYLENGAPFAATGAASYASECSVIGPSLLIDDLELETPQQELPKLPAVPPPPLAWLLKPAAFEVGPSV